MILQYIFIVLLICGIGNGMWIEKTGPRYPPTKGEVWPKPAFERKENIFYSFNPWNFQIKVMNKTCHILTDAINRYINIFKHQGHKIDLPESKTLQPDINYAGILRELEISLLEPCEKYPYLGMDESYKLNISTSSQLISNSIWGALRGLETFSHLIYFEQTKRKDRLNEMFLNKTVILDSPRYKHRGLLLDTSRHFISLSNILKTLDAMGMNKMNVFHWHIVDDQSFPYQSKKFPRLSGLGAYHKSMVYTEEEIKTVIEFARNRGIRVIPEFDVPGHTTSWGEAYPDILTDCYKNNKIIGKGPLDPINNNTYILLKELFQEVQLRFPDQYFHLGGDEVQLDCWQSNPKLQQYMKEHDLSVSDLHGLFMKNVTSILDQNTKLIVWQDVFDEGIFVSTDTLIQVWKNFWFFEIIKILYAGNKIIFSSTWYLSDLKSEWFDFYAFDPRKPFDFLDEVILERIVGGEACMWGEMVDNVNVLSRVWPRASAVAEKLWSDLLGDGSTKESIPRHVYSRIEEHACRMLRRNIKAQPPSGPGFCIV